MPAHVDAKGVTFLLDEFESGEEIFWGEVTVPIIEVCKEGSLRAFAIIPCVARGDAGGSSSLEEGLEFPKEFEEGEA